MALKTILVCLTTAEHADTILNFAIPLARKHNAHLIGLHIIEALLVYPGIAMHMPGPGIAHFNKSQRKNAEEIRKIFEKHTKIEDFTSEYRLLHTESASAAERMVESARTVDLVIMSHESRQWDKADQSDAQDRVIRESGRPVIVVPQNYDGPVVGQNILLGWSDTREAAHAAHDITDLAFAGANVKILRVGFHIKDEFADYNANALAENYARRGLKVSIRHCERGEKNVAETLNQVAFEAGADLIATGAFGHSRTYDFVVGAATYDLLKNSKLPVLFSK